MSKRASAAPSTPRKKKPKFDPDQQGTLDAFFLSPSGRSSTRSPASDARSLSKGAPRERASTSAPGPFLAAAQVVIDVDALDGETSSAPRRRGQTVEDGGDVISIPPVGTEPPEPASKAGERRPQVTLASLGPSPGLGHIAALGKPSEPLLSDLVQSLSTDPPFFDLARSPWRVADAVPYAFLTEALSQLTATKSRIAITNILTNTLRAILKFHSPSLLPALYLLSNTLSPPYSPIELGIGGSTLNKAIQHVSGLTPAAIKRLWNSSGDPGDVAFEAKSNVRTLVPHPPLLVAGVYDALLKIAAARGQGAARQKQTVVERLLVAAKGEEIRFLARTLSMNLRVGAVRTTLLTALARAVVLTPAADLATPVPAESPFGGVQDILARIVPLPENAKKKSVIDPARAELGDLFASAEALMKRTYVQHPNYATIVDALREAGLDGLAERVPLTIGVPLHPTLGSPTRSLDEIYERLHDLPFTAEFKYDGQRAQIHARRQDGKVEVSIFSRHLENMTSKYPDIVHLVEHIFSRSEDLDSFILDAEVVAIDPNNGTLRTFQELSNRARKDVAASAITVSVCVYAFDLMYLNGQVFLTQPFRKRRDLLRAHLPPVSLPPPAGEGGVVARMEHVQSCESSDGREAVESFWQEAVESRCEGLMIKLLDNGEVIECDDQIVKITKSRKKPLPATYEPDKRTTAWLKLKKDYVSGLGDSLDLVPIGAWHGIGRKSQWWSPILLAVWDPRQGRLVALCKCMSGFTDSFYKAGPP